MKPRVYFTPEAFSAPDVKVPRTALLHWDVLDGVQVVKIECTVDDADYIKTNNTGWFEWPE